MDNAGNLLGKLRTSPHPKLSFGELGGQGQGEAERVEEPPAQPLARLRLFVQGAEWLCQAGPFSSRLSPKLPTAGPTNGPARCICMIAA